MKLIEKLFPVIFTVVLVVWCLSKLPPGPAFGMGFIMAFGGINIYRNGR